MRRFLIWCGADTLLALISLAVFLEFADHSQSGDFRRVLFDVTHDVTLLKAEPLSTTFMWLVGQAAAVANLRLVEGLALGVALAGAIGVVMLRRLSFELSRDDILWGSLGFVTVASSAAIALFFGHIETYTIATVAALAFLFLGVKAASARGSAAFAIVLFGIASALHMEMLCLTPAAAFLAVSSFQRTRSMSAFATFAVITVGLLLLQKLCLVFPPPYPQFYGGGDGRMFVVPSRLFTPRHLLGCANLLLLACPGFVILTALGRVPLPRTPQALFLSIATAGWLVFVFVWNPDLGMLRDWDLFITLGFVASAYAVSAQRQADWSRRRFLLLVQVTALNVARTVPFVLHENEVSPTYPISPAAGVPR